MTQDFSYADLREHDFRDAELNGTNFCAAKLQGADFRGARLKGADLTFADLSGAILEDCDLTDARLLSTILVGARLDRARLDRAEFGWAKLTGASLAGAIARGIFCFDTTWKEVNAEGIDLRQSHLRHCDFSDASFLGGEFSESLFWGCVFHKTDLRHSHAVGTALCSSPWLECRSEGSLWVNGVKGEPVERID